MKWTICYKTTEKDLLKMIALDSENYIGADIGDFNICSQWLNKCHDLYTILKNGDDVIGYIGFMPITLKCYNEIRNGRKKDYEISSDSVLDFTIGDNYCLFISIVIDKNYHSSFASVYLLNGFKKRVMNLEKQGIHIRSFVADCVSDKGEQLARYFNGKFICNTCTKSKIYEFNIEKFLTD